MNISSLVVKVLPGNMEQALDALKRSGLCEVRFHDRQKGVVVVLIEGKDTAEEMDKMKEIEKLPPILEAALVYAYGGSEQDGAEEKTPGRLGSSLPDDLKDA